jgi:prepilin signal peptidase PulO-like enzyme (type II secretory pathway)
MWLIVLLLFLFGLIIGSFINVVISRSVWGEDWVTGRSRCDHCKKPIQWYDNIPLLSFVMLFGKCRYCHKKIAIQHPVIELMTAFLFIWWYVIGFTFFQLVEAPLTIIQPAFWLVVGILLLIIFTADWMYQIIPDFANFSLIGLAFIYRLYLSVVGIMRWEDFWYALISGMVMMLFLGSLWAFTKGRGMGFGDVKFALGMGILLGWPRAGIAMLLAFWFGALVGSLFLGLKVKKLKDKIAFGPFLIIGTVVALIFGNQMWSAYLQLMGW